MSKHTAGPWTWMPWGDLWSEHEVLITDEHSEVGAANASLIAAAPDLLAALERIVTYYDREDRPEAVFKLDAARAAIAKAKGET